MNGVRSKLAISVLCFISGVLFLEFYFSVLLSGILLCSLSGQFCWNSGFVLDSKVSKTQLCLCCRVLTAHFFSSLRLRNGVKYCKVLRLPEVGKSTLFPDSLLAATEEVRKPEVE